jgi:hypothetical protein
MTLEMGSSRALGFALGVSWGVSCAPALASADERPAVRVSESGNDRNGSEGVVEVAASPAEVVRALTNYVGWPALFSDIASVEVQRAGRDAVVRFQARSRPRPYTLGVKSGANWVGFTLLDGRLGTQIWGTFALEPSNLHPGMTRIRGRLHAELPAVVGMFVNATRVREKREGELRRYLEDVARAYATARPGSAEARSPVRHP